MPYDVLGNWDPYPGVPYDQIPALVARDSAPQEATTMPGTGPGGTYTMQDIGYDDPVLLAQLNGQYSGSTLGGAPVTYGAAVPSGYPTIPSSGQYWDPSFNPNAPPPTYGQVNPLNTTTVGGVLNQANPCQYLPDGPLKIACQIAQGVYNAATGQPNPGNNLGSFAPSSAGGPCNLGYHWNDVLKTCVVDDVTSWLPGGTPATTAVGTPIGGNMGAVKPRQVGTVQRNDGKVTPLFRCPRGMVLGIDYNCYWKQLLPKQWRAHKPDARPLLSAHDGSVLRRAKSLEKKLRKVSAKHIHKACHCTARGRKK